MAVLVYFHFQPFGQGVDDREADAVQAAGNFIAAAAELAARVQLGEHQLDRGDPLLVMDARRDAAAVVLDRAGPVLVDGDADGVAIARQRLVDRVVDDLLHEVVQAALVRRPDVHTGALADGLQPLEDLDLLLAVFALYLVCHSHSPFLLHAPKAYVPIRLLYHISPEKQSDLGVFLRFDFGSTAYNAVKGACKARKREARQIHRLLQTPGFLQVRALELCLLKIRIFKWCRKKLS